MTEQKLKELLADMTLEEKVNQMSQVVGAFFNKDMDITAMGPMADKGFTPENVALSGSILGSMGAENVKEKSRRILWSSTRITSRCCSCWMSSTASRPFSRFRWDRAQTFEPELSEKVCGSCCKKRQPFPAFT